MHEILTHPFGYITYRARLFHEALFPQEGNLKEDVIRAAFNGWFALIVAAYAVYSGRKNIRFDVPLKNIPPSIFLSVALLMYLLPYFFTAVRNDYRYILWPVWAGMATLCLLYAEKNDPRKSRGL